jgi:hypothetical protein
MLKREMPSLHAAWQATGKQLVRISAQPSGKESVAYRAGVFMSCLNPDVNADRPRGGRGVRLLPHLSVGLLPRLLLSLLATALTVHFWRQSRR